MSSPDLAARLAVRQRPPGWPVLKMRWDELMFFHWAWDAGALQQTLPAGLTVDTYDGRAWLAVVPFRMRRVHPCGLPCLPWVSDFLECNVRTYVCDADGVPGVWFYSLLCNQPLAVELARRFFHLNYLHARLDVLRREGGGVEFLWDEAGGGAARFRVRDIGGFSQAVPGSLEFFLVERYVLFSSDSRGRIHSGRVHHRPYEIAPAAAKVASFRPAASLGFPEPGQGPDHVLVARSVEVAAWSLLRKC